MAAKYEDRLVHHKLRPHRTRKGSLLRREREGGGRRQRQRDAYI
ncbi:unnamed protein product [Spirodela intermedia]|uniref:Uncharacterized protein n=1 Tax=Spirodela intermedia TaxID=51605 RepID=A0A7I8JS14_SPIIN|nr:unnamed protein product [Spirodela intermedia]CAA6672353.1 unnamed protein product [Spirodela intermedia]